MNVAVRVEHSRSNHLVKLIVVQSALNRISKVHFPCDQDGGDQQHDGCEARVKFKNLQDLYIKDFHNIFLTIRPFYDILPYLLIEGTRYPLSFHLCLYKSNVIICKSL